MSMRRERPAGTILVVEDDPIVGALVELVLADEGFTVSLLNGAGLESIRAAVVRLEPDCILLDGESPRGYGSSWDDAAWIAGRERAVPVFMFTGHDVAIREARDNTSARSQGAGFAGVLPKPFDLDLLVEEVTRIVRRVG